MDDLKRTTEYRKLLPFIAKASSDVGEGTLGEEVQALVLALNTHKTSGDHDGRYYTETEVGTLFSNHSVSGDHDGRYYTESEITSFLSLKADKAITLTAGNGLTGGGNLSADRTFNVGQGFGLTVSADAVAVNLAANFTWTGLHTFTQYLSTNSIFPSVSDVYDLGDYNKLWRKIWGSELSAIVFSQYEQVLLGGWFTVSKGEGTLSAAVTSAQTQIDFGTNNFATNDIVVFRGISSNNTPQMEYMKVGTLVSGTTYNVTRNLDGTGANDWPGGTVYGNWGKAGNGRVELNAYDTPRMSVYSHGAAIADFREQVRIGDLSNNWGYGVVYPAAYGVAQYGANTYGTDNYGAAFGAYAVGQANITIDPNNGVRIRNYNQTVIQLNGTDLNLTNNLADSVGAVIIDSLGFHYYHSGNERVRIGSLDNWDGGSFTGLKGIALGDYQDSYLTYDQTNGLIVKGNVAATSGYLKDLSITGVLTLSSTGYLRQGTGTWGSNFTGTAIWSENSVMNMGGWNAGVKQWWGGSDGKFYAGGGAVLLDEDGLAIRLDLTPDNQTPIIVWKKATTSNFGNLYDMGQIGANEINSMGTITDYFYMYAHGFNPDVDIVRLDVGSYTHSAGQKALIYISTTNNVQIVLDSEYQVITYTASGGHIFSGLVTVNDLFANNNVSALSFTDRP